MLDNIHIVLVQTYHPGNIGATARAMKTMGLHRLTLVNPRSFPDEEATRLAAGATDILENVRIVESLPEAVADCTRVVGASARLRSLPLPHFDEPDVMARQLVDAAQESAVAVVFGRERFGLTNDEIRHCTHQVSIPANPDYGVLNLSQAVQVISYELFRAWRQRPDSGFHFQRPAIGSPQPTQAQMSHFYEHLHRALHSSGFLTQPHAKTEDHLRALFARAQPSRKELSILRGILATLEDGRDKE
ncbi:tRNA (cytosine(32)/uridine(32)-2'-O)-methyltransferase TrmJ [Halomonas shantousis]